MKEAEVPLDEILSSAVINNIKAFYFESSIDSLTPRKNANIILNTKKPLNEIEAYNTIGKVAIGGEVIKRDDLEVQQ